MASEIKKELSKIFPVGEKNDAYAQYFDGQSYLSVISREQVFIANVTFEPGCRNHWHIHNAKSGGGQMLIVISGRGYYQEWGKEARELKPGDVVHIPANVKHWHGAARDSWFQHLAVEVEGEDTSNEWCEAVEQSEYDKLR
ncbi:MAG: cupin domain-containing protein [Synergistaceae bacterium]|nr:cupin domain-containing protein [Synergistaceae bacterium]